MKNFIEIRTKNFKAYIPNEATLFLKHQGQEEINFTVTGIKSENYCLVNGIKYHGNPMIYLNSNTQYGDIKQKCEVVKKIKGSLNIGDEIPITKWDVKIIDGEFLYKPTDDEEYIMRVKPDYEDLLKDFFNNNPDIDDRIKGFLKEYPDCLDPVDKGMVHTDPDKWKAVSIKIGLTKDKAFRNANVAGTITPTIADKFLAYINKHYPKH